VPFQPSSTIRPERPEDHEAVARLVEQAFGQPDEARLVAALRNSPAFLPELSLVALDAGRVVGHVLFPRVEVKSPLASHPALALAPLAVLPAFQNRGIGSSLVRRGLADARERGHGVVIVLGHPGYYPRFGFVPAEPLGIRPPFAVRPGTFMALELKADALRTCRGHVEYPPEFGQV
jgi:putative acetyltransferase